LAAVQTGGKSGFIDRTGKVVIAPQFDDCTSFTDGLAAVMVGGKLGYIEHTGKYVWEPQG
jgi:hypothetical protein